MKLSMAERWALNKYKYRTVPSRKIISCACFPFSEVFLYSWEHIALQMFKYHSPDNTSQQIEENVLLYFSFFETAKKAEDWELTYTTNTFLFCRNFLDNCKFDRRILAVTYLFKDWKVPVSCPLLYWVKIFLLCIRWRERKHQNNLHQICYSLHIHVNPVGQGKMVEKSTEVISSVFQLTKANL